MRSCDLHQKLYARKMNEVRAGGSRWLVVVLTLFIWIEAIGGTVENGHFTQVRFSSRS